MKTLKRRLQEIILESDTEYAEFLLGMTSLITGIWLFLPFCHPYFTSGLGSTAKPEVWGSLLSFSGATKFIGVLRGKLNLRQTSCFVAMFVWWFISCVFISEGGSACVVKQPMAPIMAVLGLFNALIYIKLRLVPRR
jgi:hypothetical protein